MKLRSIHLISLFISLVGLVHAAESVEVDQVAHMQEKLREGGIPSLVQLVSTTHWNAPVIPSRWKQERETDPAVARLGSAARAFGSDLVDQLDELAPKLAAMPVSEELYHLSWNLTELADWLANGEGYGNAFLIQRAVDLAAIGSARVTSAIKTPVGDYLSLAERLRGRWETAEWCRAVLNREAGADVLRGSTREEISSGWDLGAFHARYKNSPVRLQVPVPPADPLMEANSAFFIDDVFGPGVPNTVRARWDRKWHLRIANGLETDNVQQASALAVFRTAIGDFPENPKPFVPTPKDIQDAEWAKAHPTPGVVLVPWDAHFKSPTEAAFYQAWRANVEKRTGLSDAERGAEWNKYVPAWYAYDRIQRGAFIDANTEERNRPRRPAK